MVKSCVRAESFVGAFLEGKCSGKKEQLPED
ncbi:hypothetical protein RAYM_03377 [Riemerella anatipestifer RA-YM]|nr:hypothetical protein RAYM_03377 [Riemerella anatipestifer RA-YM]